MLPTFQLSPLAIRVPGLLLILGLWFGMSLAEKYSLRRRIPANHIYTFTIAALLSAAAAARLIYVIRNFDNFLDSPLNILSLNPGLLDPAGAFLGFVLFTTFFLQKYHHNPWSLLDALVPILAVFMVALNLANLASGNGYGYPTDLPWAISLFGERRHPVQAYEMVAAGLVLIVFWPSVHRSHFKQDGVYGLCVLAATAANRLIFEAFRADSTLITGGLRSSQVTAWLILAISLWLISKRVKIYG